MLQIKPIPEYEAEGEIKDLYFSVKKTLNTQSVPLIFQYLASFPSYFSFIWKQAKENLSHPQFLRQALNIQNFAWEAMNQIYKPQEATNMFLKKIEGLPERYELLKFAETTNTLNSSLYYFSLGVRESIKGIFLGIKQIGERLSDNEKTVFDDISEGFTPVENHTMTPLSSLSLQSSKNYIKQDSGGKIITSRFEEFFKFINWEMEKLIKREEYLTRRVALERFSLSLLPFIPNPFDSTFSSISKQESKNPLFPELIYLIADLFPTQAPYKLIASTIMKKTLTLPTSGEKSRETSSPILLPPPKEE